MREGERRAETRGVAEFVWRRDSLPWLQCDHAVTVAEESFAIDVGMEDREGDDVRVADQASVGAQRVRSEGRSA